LAQFLPDRSGPVRARLRDWLERYWSPSRRSSSWVVGAILLAKARVALG
jgi:hypothetical protein